MCTKLWFIWWVGQSNVRKTGARNWQNQGFMSQKCFPGIMSNVTNNQNELWKTVRLTSFPQPQWQSISIFFTFIHPCLLSCTCSIIYTFFSYFEQLFYVLLNFGGRSHCYNYFNKIPGHCSSINDSTDNTNKRRRRTWFKLFCSHSCDTDTNSFN